MEEETKEKELNELQLLKQKALNRKLTEAQEKILKFMSIADATTPEIISIATGYAPITITKTYLPELLQYRLVKWWRGEKYTARFKTNILRITVWGRERTHTKRKHTGMFKSLWHHILKSEVMAYLFKEHPDWEIGGEGDFKALIRKMKEDKIEETKSKYGDEVADEWWLSKGYGGLPIPDLWQLHNEVLLATLYECETLSSLKRLKKKIEKYNKLEGVLRQEEYLELVVVFVTQDEEKKIKLRAELDKHYNDIKFDYRVECINRLDLYRHHKKGGRKAKPNNIDD